MRLLACVLLLVLASVPWTSSASAQLPPPPTVELPDERPTPTPRRSLNGPIGVTGAGAALSIAGGLALLVVGLQSADVFEDGPPSQPALYIGSVALGAGIIVLFAGLYWLLQGEPERAAAALDRGAIRF